MDQSPEATHAETGVTPGIPESSDVGGLPVRSDGGFEMMAGTIELRSGRWKWAARTGEQGSAYVFHDERSPGNRMRTWVPGSKASNREVLQAAREPDVRWWEDPVGTIWEARTEETRFPSKLEQRSRPRMRITFHDGGRRIGTELPEGRTLGELTAAELTALLYESD